MPRLLFEKMGNAVWISHLDLMRLFQRAFKRAGYPLTHTHGYNPRPSVSIALPLSVGIESQCELLDFDLDCGIDNYDDIKLRLNEVLVDGVRILDVFPSGKKIRDLSLLQTRISLHYDNGVPDNAARILRDLFSTESIIVTKKTKNGMQDQDIIPMIHLLDILEAGEKVLVINVVHCCQNPTLNPTQIVAAIQKYASEAMPDVCKYRRIELYDKNNNIFR